jgi:amino acid transporter
MTFLQVASMSEEARNPSVDVPKAMVWSVPIGAVCGVVFLLPIVFTLPDITTLLAGTSHFTVGKLFAQK